MNDFTFITVGDTGAEWSGKHVDTGYTVSVDKAGGGTVGHVYEGLWYITARAECGTVVESESLYTDTPETHQEAACIAMDMCREEWS